jgi:nucleoside phosphorylase
MILIISALNVEVNFIKKHCNVSKIIGEKPFEYFKCNFKNLEFFVAKSGLGKIRTASFLQYSIDNFKEIALIINFGSAGAVSDDAEVGDLYFCTKAIEYDFYTTRDFKPQFEVEVPIPCNNILQKLNIKKGIIISGTQNIDSKNKKENLLKKYNASIGDWEASAVMQVSALNKKKCFVFKAVTDKGDENIFNDYKKNYQKVLGDSSLKVLQFIEKYVNNYLEFI